MKASKQMAQKPEFEAKLNSALPDILKGFKEVLLSHGIDRDVTFFMLSGDDAEKDKAFIAAMEESISKLSGDPETLYCKWCCDYASCKPCCIAIQEK